MFDIRETEPLLSISRACVYYTQTEARDARGDFSVCVSLNEDIH